MPLFKMKVLANKMQRKMSSIETYRNFQMNIHVGAYHTFYSTFRNKFIGLDQSV